MNNFASNTTIIGNKIGTNIEGTSAIGNAFSGIALQSNSSNTNIGGSEEADRNIISGNGHNGIWVGGEVSNTEIDNNFIGTDITGNTAIPNIQSGISIDGATNTSIGLVAQNLIAGNGIDGVRITGNTTSNTDLQNNLIGLNSNSQAIGNTGNGVTVSSFAYNTTIESNNTISGNGDSGIWITDFANTTIVRGNKIGTNTDGTASLGNGHDGIAVENNALNTTIGGSEEADRNIISGNIASGILLGSGVTNTFIDNNFIGTDLDGMIALPNTGGGIYIEGASSISIGLSAENLISGNGDSGITLRENASDITIEFNKIGTKINGTEALPNTLHGIDAAATDEFIFIGSNIISGNTLDGIHLGEGADMIDIAFNKIGTDSNETFVLGNGGDGVKVENSNNTEIFENTIAYNQIGVEIGGTSNIYGIHLNSIYCNTTSGITLSTSNTETDAPVVEYSTPNGITGTAAVNSTIEIFIHDDAGCNDAPCQGKIFLGTATTDESGYWGLSSSSFTQSLTIGETIVGTGTINGNTSEFSACSQVCPTINPVITGETAFCEGEINTLIASSFSEFTANYLWSTGEDAQQIEINTGGIYTVTVTDGGICSGTAMIEVTQYENPFADISAGDEVFCSGTGLDIFVHIPANSTNIWSNDDETQLTTIETGGIYTVTVTNENDCSTTASVFIEELVQPNPEITGNFSFCEGESTILSLSEEYVDYLWSNGSIDSSIEVTEGGFYGVTVSNGTICIGLADIEVIQNLNPNVVINTPDGTSFCSGNTINLTASSNAVSPTYLWSDGTVGENIEVSEGGTYTVTITDDNDCSNTANIEIEEFSNPVLGIEGKLIICPSGSTVLTANDVYASYLWSTGSEEPSIEVNESGLYSLLVTDENGCTAEDKRFVGQNNLDVAITGKSELCDPSILLSTLVSGGVGEPIYKWSTGETEAEISVTEIGTYTVTVTDSNDCTAMDEHIVGECINCDVVTDIVLPDSICTSVLLTFEEVFTENTTAGGEWNMIHPDGSSSTPTEFLWFPEVGFYTVTYSDTSSTSTCSDSDSDIIYAGFPEEPFWSIEGGNNEVCRSNLPIALFPENEGGFWCCEGFEACNATDENCFTTIDGQTYFDPIIDPNNAVETYELSYATSFLNCKTHSTKTVNIYAPPSIPEVSQSVETFCLGEVSDALLFVSAPIEYTNQEFTFNVYDDLGETLISTEKPNEDVIDFTNWLTEVGTYTFSITTVNGTCESEAVEVSFFVEDCSSGIEAVDDVVFTSPEEPTVFNVLTNDTGCDISVAGIVLAPSCGQITDFDSESGSLTYVADENTECIEDTFVYEIVDCVGETAQATVTIFISQENTLEVEVQRNCEGVEEMGTYRLDITVTGGTPPFTIFGSLNKTLPFYGSTYVIIPDGQPYEINVTDANANEFFIEGGEVPCAKFASCLDSIVVSGILCPSDNPTVVLYALPVASSFEFSYEWSTGETTQNIEVAESGVYSVTILNTDGCSGAGSVEVIEDCSQIEAVNDTILIWGVGDFSMPNSDPLMVSFNILENDLGEGIILDTVFYDADTYLGESLTFADNGDVFFLPTDGEGGTAFIKYRIQDANGKTALADVILDIDVIIEATDTEASLVASILGECVSFENATVTGISTSYTKIDAFQLDLGASIIGVDASELPFSEGILLTTGSAYDGILSPNTIGSLGTNNETGGDADLANEGEETFDACALEFDFTAISESISFPYWFGSEEYIGGEYPDRMAIFISGGIFTEPTNIAVLPNTNIPIGVETVNQDTNEEYFKRNGYGALPQYDGFTTSPENTPLEAIANNLTIGETYHIKIVIADVGDAEYDSGVFIKANVSAEDLGLEVSNDVLINQGENTQLSAEVLNTTANVAYSWSPIETLDDANSATPMATPSETTTYYVTASLGTCELMDSVLVTVTEVVVPCEGLSAGILPGFDPYVCFGGSTGGEISLLAEGFELREGDVLGYVLEDGSGTILGYRTVDANFTFADLDSPSYNTEYFVSIVVGVDNGSGEVDFEGECVKYSEAFPVVFLKKIILTTNILCDNNDAFFVEVSAEGGLPEYLPDTESYTAETPSGTAETFFINESVTLGSFNNGAIEIEVIDGSGCTSISTLEHNGLNIFIGGIEVTNGSWEINLGESVELTAIADEGTTFEWTPSEALDNANTANPTANPSETTTYTLTATVNNVCELIATVTIVVIDPCAGLSAGTLPSSEPFYVCFGDKVGGIDPVLAEGSSVKEGYVLGYVLQDAEGTSLAYRALDANFGFGEITNAEYNTEYLVSAVVGPDDGSGNVDFGGECIFYSNSISVVFLKKIILTTDILCDSNEEFFAEVSATGGLPEYLPSTELYTVETMGSFAINESIEVGPFDSDELAEIEVVDGNSCVGIGIVENYLLSILVEGFDLTNDTLIISQGEPIGLEGIVTNVEPTAIIDYAWSIEEDVITQVPTLNTTPDTSAVYTLMVEIEGNCTLTADITVLVLPAAQDCADAIVVCDTQPIYYNSDGQGVEEINGLDEQGCLGSGGEYHSTWFRLQVDDATSLGELLMFTISPNDGKEDYDFALYKSSDCNSLGVPLRSTSAQPSEESADTGLRLGATDTCEVLGIDDGFLKPLPVNGGEVYYLLVNNFAGNLQGFKLEWTGNVVFNCIPPPDCPAIGGTLSLNQQDYCDESNIVATWEGKNTDLLTKFLYLASDQNTIIPNDTIGSFCLVGLNYGEGINPNDYGTIEEIETAIDGGLCMALSNIECFNVYEIPDAITSFSKECNDGLLYINLEALEDATISWYAGDTLFVEGNDVLIEEAGTYSVIQTLNDCESDSSEVVVTEADLVCLGDCPENLVENFSFEEHSINCEFLLAGGLVFVDSWYPPIGAFAAADYFNTCVTNNFGVPENSLGTQSAADGVAYAGIVAYDESDNDISKRAFLRTKLTLPLIEGETYCVSMQVSLAEGSEFAINNLGIYFSDEPVSESDIEGENGSFLNPQIQHPAFLTDTENWMEIQGTFKATEGLSHLIIGNFDPNNGSVLVNENGNGQAYYYIDMIQIRPINEIEGFSVFNQDNEELEVIDNTVVICPEDTIRMEGLVESTNYICDLGWGNSVDELVSQASFTVPRLESDTVYQFWVSNGFCDITDSLVVVLGQESDENGACVLSVCSMAEELMNALQDVRADIPYSRTAMEVQSIDLEDLVRYELSQLSESINGFNEGLLADFEVNAVMTSLQTTCDPAYFQILPNSIVYDNSNPSDYAYIGEDKLTYTVSFPGCEPVTRTLSLNIQCPVFVTNGFTSDCNATSFKLSNPLTIAYSADTIDLEEANAIGWSYQYKIEGIHEVWQSANYEETGLRPDTSYTVFMRVVRPNSNPITPIFEGSNAEQCGGVSISPPLSEVEVEIVKTCLEDGRIELFAEIEEGYTYSFEWSTGATTQKIEVDKPFEKAYWVRVVRSDACEGFDTVSDLNPFELTLEDHDPKRCSATISIEGGIPDVILLGNEEVSEDDCDWDEASNSYKCDLVLPVTYEETIEFSVSDETGNCTSNLELDACTPRIKVIKPNPSIGVFTVELTGIPDGMSLHYDVYSADQRMVLRSDELAKDYDESLKEWRTVPIDLGGDFYSGVYYVRFIIGDGEFMLMDKLIKIE